jgi:exopolysaccharide biosynthesis predicted pyruvyltransferase EpsI
MRRDLEKALDDVAQQEMLAAVKTQYPDEPIEFTDTVIDHDVMPEKREEEVSKKLAQFSAARLIVTDRLHGMVFAALTNTPCIAMSNSNGKVKAVYEWIKGNDYIRFANSVEEFKQQLQTLDVNRSYTYDRKLAEREFAPLLEEIRKLQK